jgi:hypothetical protein
MTELLPPYQKRVIDEQVDLDDKNTKLINFLYTNQFKELDAEDQSLLCKQSEAMTVYSDILGKRIKRFK